MNALIINTILILLIICLGLGAVALALLIYDNWIGRKHNPCYPYDKERRPTCHK